MSLTGGSLETAIVGKLNIRWRYFRYAVWMAYVQSLLMLFEYRRNSMESNSTQGQQRTSLDARTLQHIVHSILHPAFHLLRPHLIYHPSITFNQVFLGLTHPFRPRFLHQSSYPFITFSAMAPDLYAQMVLLLLSSFVDFDRAFLDSHSGTSHCGDLSVRRVYQLRGDPAGK